MLHVSRMTLDKMIKAGQIKAIYRSTFITIPESEIKKWDIDPKKHNHKIKLA